MTYVQRYSPVYTNSLRFTVFSKISTLSEREKKNVMTFCIFRLVAKTEFAYLNFQSYCNVLDEQSLSQPRKNTFLSFLCYRYYICTT